MKKRVAKKITKNKHILKYSNRQLEKAQKVVDKIKSEEKREKKSDEG
jgi:hypothetical protein